MNSHINFKEKLKTYRNVYQIDRHYKFYKDLIDPKFREYFIRIFYYTYKHARSDVVEYCYNKAQERYDSIGQQITFRELLEHTLIDYELYQQVKGKKKI